MKLQKKHVIYGGMIAVALVAWGIDAAFFESAPAASPESAAAATTAAPITPAPPSQTSISDRSDEPLWLAGQLRDWSKNNSNDPEKLRDVFSIPSSWAPSRPAAVAATEATTAISLEEFQREHHLAAVIVSGKSQNALIDGRLLRIGESVGGCRLVSVSKGRADFTAPDGKRLHLVIGPEEKGEK